MTIQSRAARALRRFGASRRGNIAMLTALMLIPVLGIGGIAVDHGLVSMQHSRLTSIADSTALLGARRAKALIEASSGDPRARLDILENQLSNHFRAEAGGLNNVRRSIRILRDGADVQVYVQWSATTQSVFGSLFDKKSYEISGRSQSILSLKRYLNLFVLVDVSQSMGIGATQAEQERMFNREGCMFACHLPAALTDSKMHPGRTTYEAARLAVPPIDTRVDVARRGVLRIVEMAKEEAGSTPDRIKLGVYTFSNSLSEIVPIDSPIASQFDTISTLVSTRLVLGRDEGGSNLMAALRTLESKIVRVGDGSTSDSPQVAVIVLSDAVANSSLMKTDAPGIRLSAQQPFHSMGVSELGSIQFPRSDDFAPAPNASQVTVDGATQIDAGRIGAIDARSCDLLKDRGVVMMTIETPYVIPPEAYRATGSGKADLRFAWLESNGRLQTVSNRMRDCASSTEYFALASSAGAIDTALRKMGELAIKNQLRLMK